MITNREIDDIARAMTAAEPSGALRARVMQALEPRGARPISAVTSAKAANALIGLCAMAVAAMFLIRQPTHVTPSTAPGEVAVSAPAQSSTLRTVSAVTPVSTASTRPPRIEMSAEERAWQSRRLPALAPAEPLALDPIQPEPMSIAPISVDPIVMDPLVVPPVGTRAAGNPGS